MVEDVTRLTDDYFAIYTNITNHYVVHLRLTKLECQLYLN